MGNTLKIALQLNIGYSRYILHVKFSYINQLLVGALRHEFPDAQNMQGILFQI
jgi:hypothetical protein